MPNDYLVGRLGKRWHSGPPRVGTISMRATRFRLKAGCLAWTEKGDTVAKNNKILSLMPAVCQATNSSQGFRDLTKEEANDCETAKGMRANKGRKSNRQANIAEETDSEEDGVNEDHDDRSSRVIAQADNRSQTVYEDGEEDVNPEDEGFNTAIWPTQNDDDHQMTAISSPESKGAFHGGSSYDVKIKKSKKRARAQRSESADSEADTYQPAPKRQRFGKVASEKIHAFRQDQPDDNEIDDHEVATRQQQPRHSKTDATSNAKNSQPDSGGSDGLKRAPAANVQTASKVKTKTRLPSDKTQTLPKKRSKLTPSPTANQTGPGIDIKGMSQYGAPGARLLDPDSAEYAKVSCAAIERGDYRYFLPAVPGARINARDQVQRALGLTVIDYVQKSGKVPPGGLIKNHLRESYASQWLRLQGAFNECFDDQEPPRLFALPEWHDGFDCWGEVLDEEGAKLWRLSIGEAEIQRTA